MTAEAATALPRSRFWRIDEPVLEGGRIIKGGMWQFQRDWWDLPNFVRLLVTGYGGGKCERAGTEFYDAATGHRRVVQDSETRGCASLELATETLGPRAARSVAQGEKRCVRVTLEDGSYLDATPDHPIYTPDGWQFAGNLKTGTMVATPRQLPVANTVQRVRDEILEFAGYVMGDGGTTQRHCSFYNMSRPVLNQFKRLVFRLGGSCKEVSTPSKCMKVNIRDLLPLTRSLGLQDCSARTKRLPANWYGVNRRQAVLFLRAFFACDAHFRDRSFEITLANEGLIRDVRHLLLLLGVCSSVRYKVATCAGKRFDAWRLAVHGRDYRRLCRFLKQVPGKILPSFPPKKRNPNKDLVPVTRRELVPVVADSIGQARVPVRDYCGGRSDANYSRAKLQRTLHRFGCEHAGLRRMAYNHVRWSKVRSVVPIGSHEVYDLSVDDPSHNFVAGNMVVHNTLTLCKRMVALALHNAPAPVAIVSPTYPMARETTIATTRQLLEGKAALLQGFVWSENKASPHTFRMAYKGRLGKILIYSGDKPERLKGPNLAAAGIDEPFIQEEEVLTQMVARCRHPSARQIEINLAGTPEQLNWGYELVEGDLRDDYDVGCVQRSARENLALKPKFFKRLEGALDEKAAEAYIEGQFVNLAGGLILHGFSRRDNVLTMPIPAGSELGAGMDFNVNPMAAVVFWKWRDHVHVFDEIELPNSDTEEMCGVLRERYWKSGLRDIYPDASGKNRASNAPGGKSDFNFIREAGFDVNTRSGNPLRRDRFNAANAKLKSRSGKVTFTVDPRCRRLIKYASSYSHALAHKASQKKMSHLVDAATYPLAYLFPKDRAAIKEVALLGV